MYPNSGTEESLSKIKTLGIAAVPTVLRRVGVDQLHPGPWQVRKDFSKDSIDEMASSLLSSGINITPLVIAPRKVGGGWYIVCGERRWRGAQKAQLHELACLVADYSDEQAALIAVVDNIQREQLNPIEEGRALKDFSERGMTHDEIAETIGKSRAHVSNYIRLLGLDLQVRDHLIRGSLSASHGRLLCSLDSLIKQREIGCAAVRNKWSYKTLQSKINEVLNKPKPVANIGKADPDVERLARIITEHTGYNCIIKKTPNGWQAGFLMSSNDEFSGLLERMGISTEL